MISQNPAAGATPSGTRQPGDVYNVPGSPTASFAREQAHENNVQAAPASSAPDLAAAGEDTRAPGINPPPDLEKLQAEIRELAKQFGRNERVAAKYTKDKAKLIGFLNLISSLAASEKKPLNSSGQPAGEASEPGVIQAGQSVTFTRTVEQLAEQSHLSTHDTDKFLRWAAKGLQILECNVPEDKKVRERVITIECGTARDLGKLLDPAQRVGLWDKPVEIAVNKFKYKSLSNFALNVAIGCFLGCLFCYVPSASTIKLGWRLLRFGILDADTEWGTYCLIRRWDENHFRRSLRQNLAIPAAELAPDGHMAIMMCTNTDPYQPVFHPDPVIRKKLEAYLRMVVRRCLEILLEPEFARFKVRVQTRALAVAEDFDVMKRFGDRLLLGMSIPTLDNRLTRIYEPKAPAPTRRLEVLARAATEEKIPCYVAVAPTFPECDEADVRHTLTALAALPLHTIFHEAINVRAKNVDRIEDEAKRRGLLTRAGILRAPATRVPYAIGQLRLVEKVAGELGIAHKLHLWPDEELLGRAVVNAQPDPEGFRAWLRRWHGRISEWPGEPGPRDYDPYEKVIPARGNDGAATKRDQPSPEIGVGQERDEPEPAADSEGLSAEDEAFLSAREKVVEAGQLTFLRVGTALVEIRDYKDGLLYKPYGILLRFPTERWGPVVKGSLAWAPSNATFMKLWEATPGNPEPLKTWCALRLRGYEAEVEAEVMKKYEFCKVEVPAGEGWAEVMLRLVSSWLGEERRPRHPVLLNEESLLAMVAQRRARRCRPGTEKG